ncbi:hypothetical protein SLS60_006824 [Paraconiothyrium brasiliense]|uniref:Uncharacterized protein n=1 Tax=Paraconiothyrium brasiliense TaxID=300254 RepID=A0ABR3R7N0_9PLEO
MHSLPTKPSTPNFATKKSDSVCSIPDLTTTESSIGHIGSPTRSKGTDETQSSQAQRHLSTNKFAGLPVFQLLQNQNVNREEDIDLDQITTWVREMVLDPDDDRQKRFEKVFLKVDGVMTAGGASGQREHPTFHQGFTEHPTSHYVTTIVSGDPPKRRRKRTCGEESSQASRQESESNNNSTGNRAEPRTNPKKKRHLSCPFVKRDPSLDINEQYQPETDHYIVYQGYDSGYQSLGQESGLDTIVPAPDISEFVDLSDLPSEGQLDIELGESGHASHKDASLDLLDLEMNSSQFPESAVAGKKKRKGLENEL